MDTTKNKIISYITINNQATAKELTDFLGISTRAVFKHLRQMLDNKSLQKVGKSPKVFYKLSPVTDIVTKVANEVVLVPDVLNLINREFICITPAGDYLEGLEAFTYWCKSRNYDVEKKAKEYVSVLNKYLPLKFQGYINGMVKMQQTFPVVWLDEVYYLDFYSIEIFGKTKLGQKLLYSKQSQNKILIEELVKEISPKIKKLIADKNIDGVGFIPPTVKRDVQFMKVLENSLQLPLRKVLVTKVKTEIAVPQKTLNKLEDRVHNAEKTLIVEEKVPFNNILLIDDALGSGATLNQVAKAIKDKKLITGKVIGLAITGSLKGFDVISEV